VCNNKKSEL